MDLGKVEEQSDRQRKGQVDSMRYGREAAWITDTSLCFIDVKQNTFKSPTVLIGGKKSIFISHFRLFEKKYFR